MDSIAKDYAKVFSEEVSVAYKNKFNKDCSVYFIKLSNGTGIIS